MVWVKFERGSLRCAEKAYAVATDPLRLGKCLLRVIKVFKDFTHKDETKLTIPKHTHIANIALNQAKTILGRVSFEADIQTSIFPEMSQYSAIRMVEATTDIKHLPR